MLKSIDAQGRVEKLYPFGLWNRTPVVIGDGGLILYETFGPREISLSELHRRHISAASRKLSFNFGSETTQSERQGRRRIPRIWRQHFKAFDRPALFCVIKLIDNYCCLHGETAVIVRRSKNWCRLRMHYRTALRMALPDALFAHNCEIFSASCCDLGNKDESPLFRGYIGKSDARSVRCKAANKVLQTRLWVGLHRGNPDKFAL